ncbi:MAG: hypothetical protein IH591_03410, partial [Bacteroidales bacterium]|nr:hypothetical protein [Bacteroidales bacterium]
VILLVSFSACKNPTSEKTDIKVSELKTVSLPDVQHIESVKKNREITVGPFSFSISDLWKEYAASESAVFRQQYLEQSKQIYEHFTGSDDPSKSVDVAGFHISGDKGDFIIVSFSVPPQSNLIQMLKNQVDDKMNFGIQQGYIQKYIGLVSVDEEPFSGFYTKIIGEDGNIEVSAGLEHKDMRNTILQLTLLSPPAWNEKEASIKLETILSTVSLKTE